MSPLRSSAGPAVCTKATSSSCGDDLRERRLAEARAARRAGRGRARSPRAAAASSETDELLLTRLLADEVRRAAAGAASGRGRPRRDVGAWMRWIRAPGVGSSRGPPCSASAISSSGCRPRRRRAAVGLARRVAELEQAVAGERARVVAVAVTVIAIVGRSPPTFSRSSTTIRSAVRLPMPGHGLQARGVARRQRRESSRGDAAGEHRERDLRARRPARRAASGRGRAPPRWRSRRASARRRARRGARAA